MQEDLNNVMTREIHVMREVLANIQMEQRALLHNDGTRLSAITQDRISLVLAMRRLRALIFDKMDAIEGSPSSEFFSLKDQLLTLVEKIQDVHRYNQSLKSCGKYLVKKGEPKSKKLGLIVEDLI